jgi:hypothetical protein
MAHRRAPSTVAEGDELPMNSHVSREDGRWWAEVLPRTQQASEAESEWLRWPDDHD